MTSIQMTLRGAVVTASLDGILTTGMAGVPVDYSFDQAWDGLAKMAVFRAGSQTVCTRDLEDHTTVPAQLLQKTGCTLEAAVYGIAPDGSIILPSCWCSLGTIQPGAEPDATDSCDPTLPVWKQAMDLATEAVRQVGDIERAIDHILALQQALLGGESA